ncbi:MAG: ABC transporter ATP-binding protein [Carbonactinosporaceae bacterium]
MLGIHGLTKVWGDPSATGSTRALDGIDLEVRAGEFATVIGPSGCGKSTLMEIAAGLVGPTEGSVTVAGRPLDGPHPDVGVVFQQDATFPWLTATENVAFGLEFSGVPAGERRPRAIQALELVGLAGFADHYPSQLSGGMRQRVNIARVLASLPKIVLMDEPFGALDEQTRLLLAGEVLRIWQETGATILFITHSLNEAALLSDRIVVMTSRPGRIKEVVDNTLPRPRSIDSFGTAEFTAITHHLWGLLQSEVHPWEGDVAVPAR